MASVFDVGQYVLSRTGPIAGMKFQRLLYYSQAWSLVWDGVPLFDEEFEAWASGPVCRDIYESYQGEFLLKGLSGGNANNLSGDELETVDAVLEYYNCKPAHWLQELSRMERPWKETRYINHCTPGERSNAIIPKELMQEYYGGLESRR